MDWDREGELLAILQTGASSIILWDANTKRATPLECMKDLSVFAWAKNGPQVCCPQESMQEFNRVVLPHLQLAIGTAKGNLIIYNKRSLRKATFLGKFTKKINCATWNSQGMLALGSEEKRISVNTADGTTTLNLQTELIPYSLMVCPLLR